MTELKLPERISRLSELADNLWWSWHEPPRQLFRALDYSLWRMSGHNPVKQLREVSADTLQKAANDPTFLSLYDSVMSAFDTDMTTPNTWFALNYPDWQGPVAYFSMEYAIHNALPIYAGGLGILAGDVCKEASDLGLPLVAIGFMYPQGYFHQHISAEGWQEEVNLQIDFDEAPIKQVLSPKGEVVVARVQLGSDTVGIGVWQVQVGRTSIYLLDTNVEENPAEYRRLSARLYIADRELRMQQEVVIGVGGVRVLRALGIRPAVWHANEGHTAFMMLERVREEVVAGASLAEAMARVQAATVFTTHTPVMAGNDVFPVELAQKCCRAYWEVLGIDSETFLRLARHDDSGDQAFNMTALALRMAGQRCAVSRVHEKVARKMWRGLWPELSEDQVPISHVTNGVHAASWLAPELSCLLERHLGKDWIREHDDKGRWRHLADIPDDELWAVHMQLKHKLESAVRERMRSRWVHDSIPSEQTAAMGALFDPDVLTIAFARRFVEYKRPALLFRDMERLKRIITNQEYPVQIVFAGKSHPADFTSKHLLHQVYTMVMDREFEGRIAFIEDYDMHIARYLVQGADVWLNTPRRRQEACGTSGMKASLNGVLHLSVLDGWWQEGYNGKNGWVIGSADAANPQEDEADAGALYSLLEEEVVPLYYARNRSGVPHGWMRMVKEAVRSIMPAFCARRMLKEYTEQMYRAAAQSSGSLK